MTNSFTTAVPAASSALDTLAEMLVAFIADELVDPGSGVEADTDLLLSGMVDSLGVIQIVDFIEQTVGCEIDPADVVLEHFQDVASMVAFVARMRTA